MTPTMTPSSALLLSALLAATSRSAVAASAEAAVDCFDASSGFSRDEWTYCQPISSDLFLYYTPPSDDGGGGNVMLGLHAPGHSDGWSALALAGNGGMRGASQIVVRRDGGEGGTWIAEDRHSDDYVVPSLDESQDVKLLFARQGGAEDGGTSWGVAIRADSCDERDYPVEDRSAWMHWALGSDHDSFGYHGEDRGQFHANLMRAPPSSSSSSSDPSDGMEVVDVRMPDVPVVMGEGGSDPTNPYICSFFDLDELRREHEGEAGHEHDDGSPGGGRIHITRFSPFLNPDSEAYVHHMILFACMDEYAEEVGYEHNKVVPECTSMPTGCWEMKWPWAKGSEDVVFPDDVGMPVRGADGESGGRWLLLQMHYYNPGLDAGVADSSGVRVRFTEDLRPKEAGVMTIDGGTGRWQRRAVPAGQSSVAIPTFVVPPACTEGWDEAVNVVGVVHHEHLVGRRMTIEIERDGRNLGPMRLERRFDFNHQSLEPSSISKLLPGDGMVVTCEYDTSSRTEDVEFGDLSQQEMCWAGVVYYPLQDGRDSFFYLPPKMFDAELQLAAAACSSPATDDEYAGASLCAQYYFTDVPAFYRLEGFDFAFGALDMCNSPQYDPRDLPGSCPPCHVSGNCTAGEVLAWGQEKVCPEMCGAYGGLSVFPDTSRTSPSYTHATSCAWNTPNVFFEHAPAEAEVCEVRGDLEVAKLAPEGKDAPTSGAAGVGAASGGAVACWGTAVVAVALAVIMP